MRRKDESKKSVILDFIDEYYNIIRYRTALALMENLFKKGGISEESYERSKRLIAFRHNIKVNSIYR